MPGGNELEIDYVTVTLKTRKARHKHMQDRPTHRYISVTEEIKKINVQELCLSGQKPPSASYSVPFFLWYLAASVVASR